MVEHTVRLGMPLTEFVEQYNQQPFELVNGEVIVLSPNVAGHNFTAKRLLRMLDQFIEAHKLGELAYETPFALTDTPDWVKGSRTPDLMFFRADRWMAYIAAMPDWKEKPYILVPDLAIEVVSPTDRYSEIDDKVESYLGDGVQIVWVVDPQRRKVTVHTTDNDQPLILRQNATLTGGEVLPGFNASVKSLFE
jgi:Uma2 family endonuclease